MNAAEKRPISLAIVALIFTATGVAGVILHASQLITRHPLEYDALWALLVSLIAVVCGIYILRQANWARWLATAWMAFHVVLSAFHSRRELIMHSFLLLVFTYLLFRPQATKYFRASGAEST